jgi:2-haloacid dehalogenase
MNPTYVFDAYGTLFDVHSAVARHADLVGPEADAVSALWRARQLEYSWIHGACGHYADFQTLTERALRYALAAHGLAVGTAVEKALLEAYATLSAYPEVPAVLAGLKAAGARIAILSNATPGMLEQAVAAAGLEGIPHAVLSVDAVRRYKPDPAVYALVCQHFDVPAGSVRFQSSNAWDIAGASACGLQTAWINRSGLPREYPDMPADRELSSLMPLLDDVPAR